MPFRKLFLSRWAALLWAAGIVWTAIDVAGVKPAPADSSANAVAADATGMAVNDADLAILANVMRGD